MAEYSVAASRHWRDGEHLWNDNRLSNADQLYGFAAECALKTVLVVRPGPGLAPLLDAAHWVHIDRLWDRCASAGLRKKYPNVHALLHGKNPYHDWSTGFRYEADDAVAQAAVASHRQMAKRILSAAEVLGVRTRN